MKKYNLFQILFLSLVVIFSSCSTGGDGDDQTPVVNMPNSYEFLFEGTSTVACAGQTARLKMAAELMSAMNDETKTKSEIMTMFDGDNGSSAGFANATLNGTTKIVGSKTAASSQASATVKAQFDAMVTEFADVVSPAVVALTDASAGVAGVHTGPGGRTVKVNAKGMELNQCFGKGLIGGMCADQILYKYLAGVYQNSANYDHVTRDSSSNNGATEKEHKYDEGYGYLFGLASDLALPESSYMNGDVLLAKYTNKVNNGQEVGIYNTLFDAFKLGRAAVTQDVQSTADEQIDVVRKAISRIIAYKAIDYLESAATSGGNTSADMADYFHDLSEGYGFIMSLQFTFDEGGTPYFTNAEVNNMLASLEAGNGFWDRTAQELTDMANNIKSRTGL